METQFCLQRIIESKVRERELGFEYESLLIHFELFSKSHTSLKLVLLGWVGEERVRFHQSPCAQNFI